VTLFRPIAVLSTGIFFIFLTTGAKIAQQTISLEYNPNAKVQASPAFVPPVMIFFDEFKSETNYDESLNDSLVMIVETLFQDQDFIGALGEKTVPPRPVVPEPSLVKEPPVPAAKTPVKPHEPAWEFIEHLVFPGETLATIAKWYAGDTTLWPVIAQHNPGQSPFKLKGGEVVRVPLSLATLHVKQPEYSTAAGPASRQIKKGPKGPPTAPSVGAPSAPAVPVFGPK